MRKAFTIALLIGAFGALWVGTAQAGDHASGRVCTNEQSTSFAQCTRVEVSPEVNVPELGVGEVVDDVTDTVTDLVGGLL